MTRSEDAFSDRIRIRVCGLLFSNDALLLMQLHSPVIDKLVWTPPGGGLKFGETMFGCLKREFTEETGLEIKVDRLVHVNELVRAPFHAIEFYFTVTQTGGKLGLGSDPELSEDRQLLRDVQWKPLDELDHLTFAPESLIDKVRNRESISIESMFSPS